MILVTNLDIICLCETFLPNSEAISLERHKWIGHNRTNISRTAVQGSGGVGVLVKESMFDRFSIDIADKRHSMGHMYSNRLSRKRGIHMCMLPTTSNL